MIDAIFVGGYGKKLSSISSDFPKVLLPLKNDFLILDRQLMDFKNASIREVYLLTGYIAEKIENSYDNKYEGMTINYLREREPMRTLWSLRNLYANTESDVLLRNGDTICDVDLMKFIKSSISNGKL